MHAHSPTPPTADPTPWVWLPATDGAPRRRVDRLRFRRDLRLDGDPDVADLTVSACLLYQLRVNGALVGVGPGRSYPEFREADSYDLRDRLTAGDNRIELDVLHWDTETFHNLREAPGFVAWGRVGTAAGDLHDLATPGAWGCRRIEGVADDAPCLSFAQGPVEILDLRQEPHSDAEAWHSPVAVERTHADLPRRTIPALTQIPIAAATVASAATTARLRHVGARVVADTSSREHAAMATWVHADRDQTVEASVWWGEYWLNAERVATHRDPVNGLRQSAVLALRKGWNHLVTTQRLAFGYADLCVAVPAEAGLRFRAARNLEGDEAVLVAGPFDATALATIQPPSGETSEPYGTVPWRTAPVLAVPPSPLRHIAWATPARVPDPTTLPLRIDAGTQTLLTVDLGKLALGRLSFDVDAPAGTVLDVAHAEERREGRAHIAKAVTVYGADRWILPGGRTRLESFNPRGCRYLDILVSEHSAPVTIHGIGVVEQRYPLDAAGRFECSDDELNRLWSYGLRTLELCSEDVFTDCPWRERTLYGGDLLPEMATTVAVSSDLRLVRRSLEVLLQSHDDATGWMQSRAPNARGRSSLSEYPVLTAVATAWYVRLTGDEAFARRAWPVFRRMVDTVAAWRRPDGLYAPPMGAFIDHGRQRIAGATCALNASFAAGFRAWAEIARRAGATNEAEALAERGDALDALVTEAFFDREAGSFRDLPIADGGRDTEGSPANSWPLLFCRSARRRRDEIVKALARNVESFAPDREPASVSSYQMFFLLAALREQGEAGLAETAIRRVYAQMLAEPTGTLWEHSHPEKSLVHAWSSGVNDYLATAVLGVRLGFSDPDELARVVVAPCAESIAWARGRVPHPLGLVEVAWERHADRLDVTVAAPSGVAVTVAPAGPLADIPCRVHRKGSPTV